MSPFALLSTIWTFATGLLGLGLWAIALLAIGGLALAAGHAPQIPNFIRRYVMLGAGLALGIVYGAAVMRSDEIAERSRQVEINRQALLAAQHRAAELQSERAALETALEEAIRDAEADPAGAHLGLDRRNVGRLRGVDQARP